MSRAETENVILQKIESIQQLKDVDSILEAVLLEARKLARADAGTIFLASRSSLTFGYVQTGADPLHNDAISSLYMHYTVPIDKSSIVGYTATTGQQVIIDDANRLSPDLPFSFNSFFDRKTGYRTRSVFTLPLKTMGGRLVGVMQLINAMDRDGRPSSFSAETRSYISFFANYAASAIERGRWGRELILRMIKMAELRDPGETAAHVHRVSAISVEIYSKWAGNRNLEPQEIKRFKDLLRPAAMLHDVGKVGIPDEILKKPGGLTDDEFELIKLHTAYGANLFENTGSDLDRMGMEIALNHHEKWDGTGYPGYPSGCVVLHDQNKRPKKGEEIPLAARIVALADVFDALANKRTYKKAWPREEIYAIFRQESGKHFDPELVEIFLQITDVVEAIQLRYQDSWQSSKIRIPAATSFKNPNFVQEQQLACGCPRDIFKEIKLIISMVTEDFNFDFLELTFVNVIKIFSGEYPGYQVSNTFYHNLNHTMAIALAVVRLIHGLFVKGTRFSPEIIENGVLAAWFHDIGLIQKKSDREGTGAKYTKQHEERSIQFLLEYMQSQGRDVEDSRRCAQMIKCTKLTASPQDLSFESDEVRLMGYILGTADIVSQMADRGYLERLPLLFEELREGGVAEYESTVDIYHETVDFFQTVIRKRLFHEFDGVIEAVRFHFQKRWNVDRNLYIVAIENNINYIQKLNEKCPDDLECYQRYLRRQINY
ncbi:cyclic di-GMP phosphodiesterase response regulator RpfG [bacterium BMS3Bbin14]|nr:cyclic di-GMP phosphodiesterase response regulator RpfG [bacterium BMS3Bbin14]